PARTEALRFRMVQVPVEIRFVCFRHSALTVSCRVECVRKTVLILVVWVIDVDRHQVHPVALILLKLRSQCETGWIDVGGVAYIREDRYEKDAVGAESIPSMQPFQKVVTCHGHSHHLRTFEPCRILRPKAE